MPSQEDYLDALLRNLEQREEGQGQSDTDEFGGTDMAEFPERNEENLDESVADADIAALLKEMEAASGLSEQGPEEALPEHVSEGTLSGQELEEPAIGPEAVFSGEEDSQEADISSMSEDEIERLLAESRETAEESAGSSKEEFSGDVVDLLADTADSDLKEIHSLLEKSDNNEAVGEEITALLQGGS